ncbi:MAG: chloride channel protein, partial [Deltaproteobacteria bacterium]|nr:chloride channel protein [Deltaproteobacteria bacterium]
MRALVRLLVAVTLGLLSAYGALVFRALIGFVRKLAFPTGLSPAALKALPWYRVVLPPAVGGLIVSPLVHFFAPEAKGHGVPEVKDACARLGGRIRPRVALVKILASGITIGSGGSVGREGPIVQIGAGLGSLLGRLTNMRGQYLIDFVAAGAAAGIAATFNAPIAGVMFAIEVILGRGSPRHFGPLIIAAVVATVVTHHHLGASPAFAVPAYTLASAWELPLYALLGLLAGGVGVAFTRGLYGLEDAWELVPLPPYALGVFGGAAIGTMALAFPEVLGIGYGLIEQVLGMSGTPVDLSAFPTAGYLLVLVVMKIVATGTTIGSGGSGGVFAPSLFLGASLGGAFGGLAQHWMPADKIASPSAYALVGTGALVGATTHAPLTAILIVFELCNRHSIILPLMFATILGTTLAMWLMGESIYTLKLVRRGASANSNNASAVVRTAAVTELMLPNPPRVRPSATMGQIVDRAHEGETQHVYITDDKRHLLGVVSMEDVASHVGDKASLRRKLRARSLMHPAETVTTTDNLDRCLQLLQNRLRYELPVVDTEQRLVGRITRADLLGYYNREVLRRDAVMSMVEGDAALAADDTIACLGNGEAIGEIPVGGALLGKTLQELNLRMRLGINVYAIRRGKEVDHVPSPAEPLQRGSLLLVIGPESEV